MTHFEVDLNADMGESFGRWTVGDDSGLLGIVTSANSMSSNHCWRAFTVLKFAAALQRSIPDAVLVGGCVAAMYAGHRDSYDHDHNCDEGCHWRRPVSLSPAAMRSPCPRWLKPCASRHTLSCSATRSATTSTWLPWRAMCNTLALEILQAGDQ